MIQEAFAAEPGEYLIASNTGDDLRVILVVDEVIGADPAAAELGEIGTINELIGAEIQGDIMVMAQNALLSEYGADQGGIDAALVDQALGRDTNAGQ